ncbi:ABC transporter permease [Amantichitinum ursilacus]|uniref:Inner membrane ABC transporter permease protein YtfT n=1 Tax=Amantichitinum ursilacus TaxID=857265 RepID=A0A0N0XLL9_9NEIS|nr:ABC transporter permease [Amantichitinum ursilacus]KPC55315.1 Inner membrane ABC transporter permease protein YtfT [Amantichitinum ursilacus]
MNTSRLAAMARHPLALPLIALIVLLVVNRAFNATFFHIESKDGHLFGSLIDILNRASPLALVALGMTPVIATRGVDVSVGAVVAICAAVAAVLIGGQMHVENGVEVYVSNVPMPLAILAALAVGLICGLWNGTLVSVVGMQPIIATLILMVAGRGIAQLLTSGQIITIYYQPYFFLGAGYLFGLPFSLFIVAAVLLLLWLLTQRTALGLFITAIGINPVASYFAGVKARAITLWVFGFCGLTAAMAGLMISSNVKSADGNNAGLLMELDAILAVTLGGTSLGGGKFSLIGTVIGALIIQTLTYTTWSLGVPPEANLVVKAVVVFIVCVTQSDQLRQWLVRKPLEA